MILFKIGKYNEAEQILQESILLDPKFPLCNYYLSLVHFQMKDLETSVN